MSLETTATVNVSSVGVTSISAGDNNIGNVDIVTVPADPFGANADAGSASGSISAKLRFMAATGIPVTSLPATPAGTNLIGQVSASNETATIYNGSTALTPKFAIANVAASQTDSSVVAAVTSKKIRIVSFRVHVAATATNVTFNTKPAGSGTAISELFACGVNAGRSESYSPVGHFQTNSGEGLTVTTGAGSTVGVGVVYVEV